MATPALGKSSQTVIPSRTDPVLKLEFEKQPAITVVHCSGKVLLDSWAEFSVRLRELIPEGKPIRVDLANVTAVNSVGIGTLVSVWAAAKERGCDLKFIRPNKQIEDVVEITRLHGIFEDA